MSIIFKIVNVDTVRLADVLGEAWDVGFTYRCDGTEYQGEVSMVRGPEGEIVAYGKSPNMWLDWETCRLLGDARDEFVNVHAYRQWASAVLHDIRFECRTAIEKHLRQQGKE